MVLEYVKICTPDNLPEDGFGAILTTDRNDEERLRQVCSDNRFAVQEIWKELLPDAPLLISSAICGGNLRTRFEEAASKRRCCLLLEPIRMQFPLPCFDGCGEPVRDIPNGKHFYSDALCCYYAHTPTSVILWDTEETLNRKIQLAKDAGFFGVTYK